MGHNINTLLENRNLCYQYLVKNIITVSNNGIEFDLN
jgi:hypothetical protein